jgi:hypothetical protein
VPACGLFATNALFGKDGGTLWYTCSEASEGATKLNTLNPIMCSKTGNSVIIVINASLVTALNLRRDLVNAAWNSASLPPTLHTELPKIVT